MAEDILFTCSTCGQSLEAPGDMAGLFIECPQCQAVIGIPRKSGEPAVATAPDTDIQNESTEEDKGATVRIKLPPNLGVPDKPQTRQIFIKRKAP